MALEYTPAAVCWKRLRDDVFIVWLHKTDELEKIYTTKNSIYYRCF